jgi:hypothetical protein
VPGLVVPTVVLVVAVPVTPGLTVVLVMPPVVQNEGSVKPGLVVPPGFVVPVVSSSSSSSLSGLEAPWSFDVIAVRAPPGVDTLDAGTQEQSTVQRLKTKATTKRRATEALPLTTFLGVLSLGFITLFLSFFKRRNAGTPAFLYLFIICLHYILH